MQIEKLSKELKSLRKLKSDEYGPFNKKMQDIADVWSVLIGKKIRPHQVAQTGYGILRLQLRSS